MSVLDRKLFKQQAQSYANGGHVKVLNPGNGRLVPDTKGYPFYDENNPRPSLEDQNIYRDSYLNQPKEKFYGDIGRGIQSANNRMKAEVDASKEYIQGIPSLLARWNLEGSQALQDKLGNLGSVIGEEVQPGGSVYEMNKNVYDFIGDIVPDSWLPDDYANYRKTTSDDLPDLKDTDRKLKGSGSVAENIGDERKKIEANIKENAEIKELIDTKKKAEKIPVEDKISLAEELGIDLTDPYDDWSWVRDMSAGLLASEAPTLFEAWGDAALMSNQKRDLKEHWAKEMDAKLKLAKWKMGEEERLLDKKYDYEYDIETMKEQAKKYGEITCKSPVNGLCLDKAIKIKDRAFGDYSIVPVPAQYAAMYKDELVTQADDPRVPAWGFYVKRFDEGSEPEAAKEWRTYTKDLGKEGLDSFIEASALKSNYKGNKLLERTPPDDMGKTYFKFTEAATENYRDLIDLMEDPESFKTKEGREEISSRIMAAEQGPALNSIVFNMFDRGPYQEYGNIIKDRLRGHVNETAKLKYQQELSKHKFGDPEPDKTKITANASDYVLQNIKWDLDPTKDDEAFWNFEITKGQYEDMIGDMDTVAGTDEAGDWTNFARLNLAENTEYFPKPSTFAREGSPFQKAGESPLWNKNQYQLLENKGQVNNYMTTVAARIAKELDISEADAREDVMNAFIGNQFLHGGEDKGNWFGLGPEDEPSKFTPPSKWKLEPNEVLASGELENPKTGKIETIKGKKIRDVMRSFGMWWNPVKMRWMYSLDDSGSYYTPEDFGLDSSKLKDINP